MLIVEQAKGFLSDLGEVTCIKVQGPDIVSTFF